MCCPPLKGGRWTDFAFQLVVIELLAAWFEVELLSNYELATELEPRLAMRDQEGSSSTLATSQAGASCRAPTTPQSASRKGLEWPGFARSAVFGGDGAVLQ